MPTPVMLSPITTRTRDHNEQQMEADRKLAPGYYKDERNAVSRETFLRSGGGGRVKTRRGRR